MMTMMALQGIEACLDLICLQINHSRHFLCWWLTCLPSCLSFNVIQDFRVSSLLPFHVPETFHHFYPFLLLFKYASVTYLRENASNSIRKLWQKCYLSLTQSLMIERCQQICSEKMKKNLMRKIWVNIIISNFDPFHVFSLRKQKLCKYKK